MQITQVSLIDCEGTVTQKKDFAHKVNGIGRSNEGKQKCAIAPAILQAVQIKEAIRGESVVVTDAVRASFASFFAYGCF